MTRTRMPPRDGPTTLVTRRSRPALFVLAGVACVLGSLFTGPQTFGVLMVDFDEQVVDAHAALIGLFGVVVLTWLLLGAAIFLSSSRRTRDRAQVSKALLCLTIALQLASVGGLTEHLGLLLFG